MGKGGGGVLFIPEGVYNVTRKLQIKQSNTVVRGDGPGRTILRFFASLTDVYGNTWKGRFGDSHNSEYCWSDQSLDLRVTLTSHHNNVQTQGRWLHRG